MWAQRTWQQLLQLRAPYSGSVFLAILMSLGEWNWSSFPVTNQRIVYYQVKIYSAMLQIHNNNNKMWVLSVLVTERCPYLIFFDKWLSRFTQVYHQRFEDTFRSDGDVHSLSKSSYYELKPHAQDSYSTMDPTDSQLMLYISSKTCKVLVVCCFTCPPLLLTTSSRLVECLSNWTKNFVSKGTVVTRMNRKNRACRKSL